MPTSNSVDISLAARFIQGLSGATRCAAMTLNDDELGAVHWRAAIIEDGVEIEPAVEEDLLAGVTNVMVHIE